jgi:receptor-type tyrosine-protein phosphatase beta
VLEETSSTQLNPVSSLHPLAPTEPDKIQNLHCRPQNSTAIACSWIPPDSDFDGYSIECRKMDTQEIEFSRKLEKEKSLLNIMMLVPHKRYLVSIKVQSAGMTSEVVEDSTITMIDRKCSQRYAWDPCHMG